MNAPWFRMSQAKLLQVCALFALVSLTPSLLLVGQQPTAGEKTRVGSQGRVYEDPGATYSGAGEHYQVAPQKAKAIVYALDLKKRSITVVPAKNGKNFKVADVGENGRTWREVDEMELTFVVPAGLEKIVTSKAAARSLGKKSISLEELTPQSEVKVEYYPVPRAILALTVERSGGQ